VEGVGHNRGGYLFIANNAMTTITAKTHTYIHDQKALLVAFSMSIFTSLGSTLSTFAKASMASLRV